jgi:porphyrinogen peroxidase
MTGAVRQAVLSPITQSAIFLVLTVAEGAEVEVRASLADVGGLIRSVGFRNPEAGLTCVVGVGAEAWDRLFGRPRPRQLHTFGEVVGARHTAVSTPGDVLFHIRAERFDLCFELAQRLMDALDGLAMVVDEVHGFRSFDLRDVLGFVDGTENPAGQVAAAAVEVGEDDPDFAGASYVLVQKYLHDLRAWDAQTVEEQERVIGRHKLDDIEMPDDVKPANSHVALSTIVDGNGEQQQIVRFNMPFGRVAEQQFGTYFIGYARSPAVLEEMIDNMFVGRPPGNSDRILDFSTATTGSLFFVPTVDLLERLPPAAPADGEAVNRPRDGCVDIGSLGIGSLRRMPS